MSNLPKEWCVKWDKSDAFKKVAELVKIPSYINLIFGDYIGISSRGCFCIDDEPFGEILTIEQFLELSKTDEEIAKGKEKQKQDIYDDLREIQHFFGGWNELREIIKVLEQEDNEAAYERQNGDAWAGGFADNH